MQLKDAAIVVAHPDDEVLWFGSLVPHVGRIILCYGDCRQVEARGRQRRAVVAEYPFDTVRFLDLPEPGILALNSPSDTLNEEACRSRLTDSLAPALANVSSVFVHNPWGEYGHNDHKRAYAVVKRLQPLLGYSIFVSGYAERGLVSTIDPDFISKVSQVLSFPVKADELDLLRRLYEHHCAWTWFTTWRWPKSEHFFRVAQDASSQSVDLQLEVFDIQALLSAAS
jgi:LmbE family N-acetylglucosaminyl deacetylase